jgi:hypothetical protein
MSYCTCRTSEGHNSFCLSSLNAQLVIGIILDDFASGSDLTQFLDTER